MPHPAHDPAPGRHASAPDSTAGPAAPVDAERPGDPAAVPADARTAVRPRRAALVGGAVAAALLAVLGLVALGLGVAERTVWLPAATVTAMATTGAADDDVRAVRTAPGVLETRPGPVTVTATADDGRPVVLVLAREVDAVAWTAGVPTTVVGGLEAPPEGEPASVLAVTPADAAAGEDVALPDPAGSDLWQEVATGEGAATLEVAPPEGRWLLLAASDGTAPAPDEITLTWPQDQVADPVSTPLVVGGAVALGLALLLAVLTALAARRRRRALAAAPSQETR